eukprot:scaffold1456_cov78-Skeletonema_dohrnii-CCMP3373.AAC.1
MNLLSELVIIQGELDGCGVLTMTMASSSSGSATSLMLLRPHVVFSMFVLSLRRRVLPTHLMNLCSVCNKLLSKRSSLVHDDATIATAVATMLHAVDEGSLNVSLSTCRIFTEEDAIGLIEG